MAETTEKTGVHNGSEQDRRFGAAVAQVLRHEGEYVDDSSDRGGVTRFGISAAAYPNLDIAGLTRTQAVEIYRRDYWERHRIDRIEHPVLAAKVFDVAVNVGPGRAIRWLQQAANAPQDGYLGPLTAVAVNEAEPLALLGRFLGLATKYYIALENKRFERGWIRRLFDF